MRGVMDPIADYGHHEFNPDNIITGNFGGYSGESGYSDKREK